MNPRLRPIISALRRMFPSVAISGSKGQELGSGSFATGRTSIATVVDCYGLVVTCLVGETRYTRGRREQNIATTNSIAVAGSMTLTLTAGDYIFCMGPGSGTATFSGTGGATGTLTANASQRTSVMKTITAGTLIITGSVATLNQIMVCDVSGRGNQGPPEYIDYNTVYNAGVVGVRVFDYANGNTVASNLVTEALGTVFSIKPTILVEPAYTQLCIQSETYTNVAWSKNGLSVTSSNNLNVTGKKTSSLITESASSGILHGIYQLITITANTNYTCLFFIKPGSRRYLQISLGSLGSAANFGCVIDTSTMTIVGTGNGASGTYINSSVSNQLANGFYLVSITGKINSTSGYLSCSGTDTDIYSINPISTGSSNWYLGGSFLVSGSILFSYVISTTASVPVSKDTFSIPSTGNIDVTKGLALLRFTGATFITAALAKFLSMISGSNLLYKDAADNNLKSNDGTNTASLPLTFSTPSDCLFALAWSSQLGQILIAASLDGGVNWTSSTANFDGSFTIGSAIEILNTIEVPCNLKSFKVYPNMPGNLNATLNWITKKAAQETAG